jgi:cytochrome c oxidase subunit 4
MAKTKQHSTRQYWVTFAVSIVLTMITFYIVAKLDTSSNYLYPFMIVLAIAQAIFQIVFWMHMNEKGHGWPILGIATGAFVALTAVIMALYWVWI